MVGLKRVPGELLKRLAGVKRFWSFKIFIVLQEFGNGIWQKFSWIKVVYLSSIFILLKLIFEF